MEGPRLTGHRYDVCAHPRATGCCDLQEQGIKDQRVLDRIRNVPRHLFHGRALASAPTRTRRLPIGFGQTISQPYVVAR